MRRAEHVGQAMGSDLHIIVYAGGAGADSLANLAVTRIALLEDCWSRFRPESELNRLNARAGWGETAVSDDLLSLVHACAEAHAWSGGDVDATVLASMVAMGYVQDFATVRAAELPLDWQPQPAGGMDAIVIGGGHGGGHHTVTLPSGTGLDPGAIGKGLAADIVSAEIMGAGATAVLISLGGDIVTRGTPPDQSAWIVSMRDDRDPSRPEIQTILLSGAHRAVATSSTLRRRWATRHHVVDPGTGLPVQSDVVQATVVAESGVLAEAGATVALIRGTRCAPWLIERGCTPYLLRTCAPSTPPMQPTPSTPIPRQHV